MDSENPFVWLRGVDVATLTPEQVKRAASQIRWTNCEGCPLYWSDENSGCGLGSDLWRVRVVGQPNEWDRRTISPNCTLEVIITTGGQRIWRTPSEPPASFLDVALVLDLIGSGACTLPSWGS